MAAARAIIGATAKTAALGRAAIERGADYVGSGAAYATATKSSSVIGLNGVAAVCEAIAPAPVVGIGGITLANALDVIAAGAHGVAVVATLFDTADVEAATRGLAQVVAAAKAEAEAKP